MARRRALTLASIERGADPAEQLAQMLVPNVRPVPIAESDCWPQDEVDLARDRWTGDNLLAGTRFEGQSERFAGLLRQHVGPILGETCSAEFRARFAQWLRSRLAPRQLRGSYATLGAYWETADRPAFRTRLMAFAGHSRVPPIDWVVADSGATARWRRNSATGRALQAAIDAFWAVEGPRVATEAACPTATTEWRAEQERLVGLVAIADAEQRHLRDTRR